MQQDLVAEGSTLVLHLQNITENFDDEKRVFNQAIRTGLEEFGYVSRKSVLFYLISELENSTDVVEMDILRSCLELMLGVENTVA